MTDPQPDRVVERLRALDRVLATPPIDPRARERIREGLAREATTRPFATKLRWWPAFAFAAGAALMALVQLRPPPPSASDTPPALVQPTPPPAPAPAPLPCTPLGPGTHVLAADACRVGEGVTLHASVPSTIALDGDRLRLVAGELELDVDPRTRPLHVLAGARDIEVIGTRFVVHQRDEGGWVALLEGRIRLHGLAREPVMLMPGDRHGWSTPRTSDAPATTPAPAPRPRARARPRDAADEGLASLLDEVAALRRAGRFADAVARLRDADTSRWSSRAQQLVSYEIGTLLERQLGDRAAACAHWRAHASRHPDGRHAEAVEAALARLACE